MSRLALIDDDGLVVNVVEVADDPAGSIWLCPECDYERGRDGVVSEEPTCPNCGSKEPPREVSLAWTAPESLSSIEVAADDRVSSGWTRTRGGFAEPAIVPDDQERRAIELVDKVEDGTLTDPERDEALGLLLRQSGLIPAE